MTHHSCSSSPQLPSNLRRQPKQQRGRERVEKILAAAAVVFEEVGYESATTHMIAAKAGTAIGSVYQFFPDKAAIFEAMELRHTERVKALWAGVDVPEIAQLPLRTMIQGLVAAMTDFFEEPVSRVVFIQFFSARNIFHSIDDSMTQDAINFLAGILRQRKPSIAEEQCNLLAEVCVHSSNAIILAGLRTSDMDHRQRLARQVEDLLVSYLEPYMGNSGDAEVMKVMICPRCQSDRLSKNGRRRGKQCFICKECARQFVDPSPEGN